MKVKDKAKAFTAEDAEDGEGKLNRTMEIGPAPRFSKRRFNARDVPSKEYIPKVTPDVLECIDLGGIDPIIQPIHG